MEIRGVDFVVHYVPNLEEAVIILPRYAWPEVGVAQSRLELGGVLTASNNIGVVRHLSRGTASERQRRHGTRLGCRRY